MRRKRERKPDKATPDLTPMIDVTFQLLIFFILCTRFTQNEENHRVDLPLTEGMDPVYAPPKEQVTIYCTWDEIAAANSYVVAIDARGRVPVEGSYARLNELVIYPSDAAAVISEKEARYGAVFANLVAAIEAYIQRSGANIEKLEIAFAKDARVGASSGTVPWMFVSLALDAGVQVNANRDKQGLPALSVTFKFADALGVYGR